MSSRSILGLLYVMKGLQSLGENPEPVLARYGMSLDTLDPSARISRELERRLYAELAAGIRDPLAGLKTGTFFGIAGYGPLTMLLMTCRHAYEAFQTGVRYQELTYLFSRLSLEPGPALTALVLTPFALPPHARRFHIDSDLSGTYKLIRDVQATLGLDLQAERIDIPYPPPPEAPAYTGHFRCPVTFGHDHTRIWIRNEHLQLRFPSHDPTAHQFYRAQCDQQLLRQAQEDNSRLADQMRAHLSLFSEQFPGVAEAAAAFGMAERSLRRQLAEEGESFRQVLDDVRHMRAKALLADSRQSVESIARQLGYAEAAAFIHAFRRWTGKTPAAFRRDTTMA